MTRVSLCQEEFPKIGRHETLQIIIHIQKPGSAKEPHDLKDPRNVEEGTSSDKKSENGRLVP